MGNYKGKHKGTRRIIIWVSGQRIERTLRGSKADGDAYEARLRVELEAGTLSKKSAPTFSNYCVQAYKPYAEVNLRGTTWLKSRRYQVATLIEFFGSKKLTDISFEDVESYKRVRLKSAMATSVNNELRVLKTILRLAKKMAYPAAIPEIKKLPTPDGRVKVWSQLELQALFDSTRERYPELLPMLIFLVNTGCRKGEALACEWSWIDFDGSMVRIPANEYWRPKSGKAREVPMSDAARAILSAGSSSKRWVFPNKKGGRYVDFPKDIFWEILEKAKLEGGPHTLRHTFASHFLQQVPDLFLLAKVMGHSHTRVTELYSHLLPGHLARARNAVNIGPDLQTVGRTVGQKTKRTVSLEKKAKRH